MREGVLGFKLYEGVDEGFEIFARFDCSEIKDIWSVCGGWWCSVLGDA